MNYMKQYQQPVTDITENDGIYLLETVSNKIGTGYAETEGRAGQSYLWDDEEEEDIDYNHLSSTLDNHFGK